jgi:hypothetical protein
MEEPPGGPYFGKLDPEARYHVRIDNTGDGREDVAYRWQFRQFFRNPNSFLDAAPTVTSVDDPDINFPQRYDLYKETYKRNGELKNTKRIGRPLATSAQRRRRRTRIAVRRERRRDRRSADRGADQSSSPRAGPSAPAPSPAGAARAGSSRHCDHGTIPRSGRGSSSSIARYSSW